MEIRLPCTHLLIIEKELDVNNHTHKAIPEGMALESTGVGGEGEGENGRGRKSTVP